LFRYRQDLFQRTATELRFAQEWQDLRLVDPDRVRFLRPDQNWVTGPQDNFVHHGYHGHRGIGFKPGSPEAHASAAEKITTGHIHWPGISGNWWSVGATALKDADYALGSYSNSMHADIITYPDGSRQQLTFSYLTESYHQREDLGLLSSNEFFGDDPLKVVENDNDLVDSEVALAMDPHDMWLDMLGKPSYGEQKTD
jgi:hypothetical protein